MLTTASAVATATLPVMPAVSGLDWVAIVAVIATTGLGFAGFRQSRDRSRDAQLGRFNDTFIEREWRMRFWRLDLGIRRAYIKGRRELKILDFDEILLSPFPPECRVTRMTPWFESMTSNGQLEWSGPVAQGLIDGLYEPLDDELVCDLFGPPFSDYRADFADFFAFCSLLHFWVEEPDAPWWATRGTQARRVRRNAEAVTAMFGAALVGTMAAHREAASRVAKPLAQPVDVYTAVVPYSRPYYWKQYGLADERYTSLFDALVAAAMRMGLMPSESLQRIKRTEARLAGLSYKADPQSAPRPLRWPPDYESD